MVYDNTQPAESRDGIFNYQEGCLLADKQLIHPPEETPAVSSPVKAAGTFPLVTALVSLNKFSEAPQIFTF